MDDLSMVRLGNATFFGLEEDGSTWWGDNLPKGLHSKLWGRQAWLPSVEYVALDPSSKHHYYCEFEDGEAQWVGPDSLTTEMNEGFSDGLQPEVVCFAPNDGWCVAMFLAGTQRYSSGTAIWPAEFSLRGHTRARVRCTRPFYNSIHVISS